MSECFHEPTLPSRIGNIGRIKAAAQMPEQEERKMNSRLAFEIVCPNNHNQTVKFTQDDFEALSKSGTLVFHCNTCDTNGPPSTEEIATFSKVKFAMSSR